MGCDIHSMAEIRWGDDGVWEAVTEALWASDYFRPNEPVSYNNVPYRHEPFDARNYYLFAFLAGVRNYGDHITPLDEPRGMPLDASSGWKDEVTGWGGDIHSLSWFDHGELLASLQTTTESNIVKPILAALAPLSDLRDRGFKVRYVFGFDN